MTGTMTATASALEEDGTIRSECTMLSRYNGGRDRPSVSDEFPAMAVAPSASASNRSTAGSSTGSCVPGPTAPAKTAPGFPTGVRAGSSAAARDRQSSNRRSAKDAVVSPTHARFDCNGNRDSAKVQSSRHRPVSRTKKIKYRSSAVANRAAADSSHDRSLSSEIDRSHRIDRTHNGNPVDSNHDSDGDISEPTLASGIDYSKKTNPFNRLRSTPNDKTPSRPTREPSISVHTTVPVDFRPSPAKLPNSQARRDASNNNNNNNNNKEYIEDEDDITEVTLPPSIDYTRMTDRFKELTGKAPIDIPRTPSRRAIFDEELQDLHRAAATTTTAAAAAAATTAAAAAAAESNLQTLTRTRHASDMPFQLSTSATAASANQHPRASKTDSVPANSNNNSSNSNSNSNPAIPPQSSSDPKLSSSSALATKNKKGHVTVDRFEDLGPDFTVPVSMSSSDHGSVRRPKQTTPDSLLDIDIDIDIDAAQHQPRTRSRSQGSRSGSRQRRSSLQSGRSSSQRSLSRSRNRSRSRSLSKSDASSGDQSKARQKKRKQRRRLRQKSFPADAATASDTLHSNETAASAPAFDPPGKIERSDSSKFICKDGKILKSRPTKSKSMTEHCSSSSAIAQKHGQKTGSPTSVATAEAAREMSRNTASPRRHLSDVRGDVLERQTVHDLLRRQISDEQDDIVGAMSPISLSRLASMRLAKAQSLRSFGRSKSSRSVGMVPAAITPTDQLPAPRRRRSRSKDGSRVKSRNRSSSRGRNRSATDTTELIGNEQVASLSSKQLVGPELLDSERRWSSCRSLYDRVASTEPFTPKRYPSEIGTMKHLPDTNAHGTTSNESVQNGDGKPVSIHDFATAEALPGIRRKNRKPKHKKSRRADHRDLPSRTDSSGKDAEDRSTWLGLKGLLWEKRRGENSMKIKPVSSSSISDDKAQWKSVKKVAVKKSKGEYGASGRPGKAASVAPTFVSTEAGAVGRSQSSSARRNKPESDEKGDSRTSYSHYESARISELEDCSIVSEHDATSEAPSMELLALDLNGSDTLVGA